MSLGSFAIIAILVVISPFVSTILRIPIVVVEMLLGTLAVYLGIVHESEAISAVAEVGFLILMFLCGMEVNLKSFKTIQGDLSKKIFLYFCILYGLSTAIVLLNHLPLIYITTFPIMGVGMIMALIKEYGKNHIWLNLALKVGVFGELLSICILVAINGFFTYGFSLELSQTFLTLFLFLLAIALTFKIFKVLFWWFPALKMMIAPINNPHNQDLRFGAMLFFIFVAIVLSLKLEVALGAFIAGMIIATFFSKHHTMHEKFNNIGFGFFVPFFFVHVGTTLEVESLFSNIGVIKKALIVVFSMLGIRLIGSFIAFRKFLGKGKNLILYALSDAMPLTFLIATATLALQLKIIDQNTYYSFVVGAMIEGIVFMILIKMIVNWGKRR